MTPPLLDTHAWVWWMNGDAKLPEVIRRHLDDCPPDQRPYLCDISLWEVATLVMLRRLRLSLPLDQWLARAADVRTVQLLRLTAPVATDITRLPQSFRRDPADRIIVSTARMQGCPVLTHDRAMLRSGLITPWRPPSRRGGVGQS